MNKKKQREKIKNKINSTALLNIENNSTDSYNDNSTTNNNTSNIPIKNIKQANAPPIANNIKNKINKNNLLWFIFGAVIILVIVLFILIILSDKNQGPCSSYSIDRCPNECVVCPPCEVCSSLKCQSESLCKAIGFNRSWYEDIRRN